MISDNTNDIAGNLYSSALFVKKYDRNVLEVKRLVTFRKPATRIQQKFNLITSTTFHGSCYFCVSDLTSSIAALLERMESLELTNSLLQQRVNVLETTVAEQEQMIETLLAADNATVDRLQTVKEELEEVEVDVQGKLAFKFFYLVYVNYITVMH